MLIKANDLTNGERLTLHRRRTRLSQSERARECGVSLYRYRQWENDEETIERLRLGRLDSHEQCFIRRRREGLTLQEVADQLNLSRWWVNLMELGNVDCSRLYNHFS